MLQKETQMINLSEEQHVALEFGSQGTKQLAKLCSNILQCLCRNNPQITYCGKVLLHFPSCPLLW